MFSRLGAFIEGLLERHHQGAVERIQAQNKLVLDVVNRLTPDPEIARIRAETEKMRAEAESHVTHAKALRMELENEITRLKAKIVAARS